MIPSIIDIHCHILPKVDDGPADLKESLAMAATYVAGNVSRVIATPHHITGTAWSIGPDQVLEKINTLQARLQEKRIALTLYPGMEIALHPYLLRDLERGQLLPLGSSNHYLLEPPFQPFREDLLEVTLSFMDLKKNVIIAHPERIPFFQKDTAALLYLVERGVELQINLGSLLGNFGNRAKKLSLDLAERGVIHYVASDSHGYAKRRPPTRENWMALEEILGAERALEVCLHNPLRLVEGVAAHASE